MKRTQIKVLLVIAINILGLAILEFVIMHFLSSISLPTAIKNVVDAALLVIIGVPMVYYAGGKFLYRIFSQNDQLLMMLDKINDLVFLMEVRSMEDFRCLSVNESYLKLTGLTEGQVIGKRPEEFLAEKEADFMKEHYQSTIEKRKPMKYKEKLTIDDKQTMVETTLVPIFDPSGRCTHLLGVAHDITEYTVEKEKLQHMALIDALTNVPNRRYYEETFLQEWEQALFMKRPLSLLLFDVDFFKQYNDTYGHLAGDECLRKVARAADQELKMPKDMVFRYGGEEFVVLLPELDASQAYEIAETIRRSIEALQIPNRLSSVSPYVTVSIGVATIIPTWEKYPNKFIQQADEALYCAKEKGRNQVYLSHVNEEELVNV
ncbi:diguanylate cyclase [Bacillus tianshenii]|nr:diguanylate cyclase [Bacillus tianshenii]